MTITHEEARRLIQFKADDALNEFDNNLLEAHLSSCPECQNYKAGINGLESLLRPLCKESGINIPCPSPQTRLFQGVMLISHKPSSSLHA